MPRYNIQFDEALRTGLKTDSRAPRGAVALDQCDYLRPTEFGLKDFLPITVPITDGDLTPGGETWTYPFPQLFRGSAITLLCFADAIYEVDESTWTGVELSLYDAADFGDYTPGAGSITSGGPWHFIDYHTTWILFNGVTTIWKTGHYSLPIATSDVTITTGCDLKGRVFYGGFDPTDFYALADWPTYWKALLAEAPQEVRLKYVQMAAGAGTNWAWWSTIGGGDMLWLVSRDLMTTGLLPLTTVLSNGSFTGGTTGWTLNTGWAYGTNNVVATTSSSNIIQQSAGMLIPLKSGKSYSVTFTVSSYSAGTVTPYIGAVGGTARSADGTFTETIVCAADDTFFLLLGAGFSGTVDDVTVSELTPGTTQWSTGDNPWDTILGRNEFGMCPLPWQGTVLCQKRLGETVICYGDGGITALVPFSSPVAGMAPMDIHGLGMGVGIASRSAVGGSQDEHVFVDNAGELWRIGTDLRAERLGYGYLFSPLLSYNIIVNFDPHRREYYISGRTGATYKCYVLTKTGMGHAPFVPTSLQFMEGGLIGILQGSTASNAVIVTNRFGSPEPKSIDEVESVTLTTANTNATGWTVYVEYRFDPQDSWSSTSGILTDTRGYARMNATGLEFRVWATHPDRTKADLDGIMVEMKSGGKRSLSPLT